MHTIICGESAVYLPNVHLQGSSGLRFAAWVLAPLLLPADTQD
jgi:hypothetical protein